MASFDLIELTPCAECGMSCTPQEYHPFAACLMFKGCQNSETVRENLSALLAAAEGVERDAARLDYIERTFSGMTNRERYLPVTMIWGKGCNGRTLREACDKYMAREAMRDSGEGR